jgi:hypothetical protein
MLPVIVGRALPGLLVGGLCEIAAWLPTRPPLPAHAALSLLQAQAGVACQARGLLKQASRAYSSGNTEVNICTPTETP